MITKEDYIDKTNTMYPTEGYRLASNGINHFILTEIATHYGFIYSGKFRFEPKGLEFGPRTFFSIPCRSKEEKIIKAITDDAIACVFVRHGFLGQEIYGSHDETSGRLVYIDGCSDTLLICPPRLGDPCLSFLHFPPGINQSYHLHPSIRMGMIVGGGGVSNILDRKKQFGLKTDCVLLEKGGIFCLDEREIHRFVSLDQNLDIVAYHPDSDWGPTDSSHPMINRTYITNQDF